MVVRLPATACAQTVTVGAGRLCIEDVLRVAKGEAGVALSGDPEFARRIRSGLKVFAPLVEPEWSTGLRGELGWSAVHLSLATLVFSMPAFTTCTAA